MKVGERQIFTAGAYQKLFVVGLLALVLAGSMWWFYQMGWVGNYPKVNHGILMFSGFFMSFIIGFVLTAVPKMTGTPPPSERIINYLVLLSSIQVILNFIQDSDLALKISLFIYLVQLSWIFYFILERVQLKKQIPFEGFIFFPFAFLSAYFGLSSVFWTPLFSEIILSFSGELFVISLISGFGSRLIPAFSRIPLDSNPFVNESKKHLIRLAIFAFWLHLSFYLQFFVNERLGFGIRFLFFLTYSYCYLAIHKRPAVFSYLAWGLKLSLYALIISALIGAIGVEGYLSLATRHVGFIGGLASITLMIATRVTVAHGGGSIDHEIKDFRILSIALLFLISGVFRFFGNSDLSSFFMQISLAVFLLSIFLWIQKFARFLIK